jgi:phosphatidylinositol glycan class B
MQHSTALALVIRVAIALATRTFFQPDEYFQALEPAHFLVFGYGELTWEWTSKPPIRSIIYPALNIPIYWLLKFFRLDETSLLVRCSRTFFSEITTIDLLIGRRLLRRKFCMA